MKINRRFKWGLFLAAFTVNLAAAAAAQSCRRSGDCYDGQACVAYTGCQKKRLKRCLNRTCYRNGVNCPGGVSCQNKHCGEVGPCIKKPQ